MLFKNKDKTEQTKQIMVGAAMSGHNYSADILTELNITYEERKKRMSRGIFETCWRIPVSRGYKYKPKEREKREVPECVYEAS
jgi:hypothetical protein